MTTTVEEILKIMADVASRDIIDRVATTGHISIASLGLTKRQYYTRYSALVKSGLIRKNNGYYTLTSFGNMLHKISCDAHLQILATIKNYYKFVLVDSMLNTDIPEEQQSKIIEELFDGQEVLLT